MRIWELIIAQILKEWIYMYDFDESEELMGAIFNGFPAALGELAELELNEENDETVEYND